MARMMAFVRTITVALVLAGTAWGTHPFESARDQYEASLQSPHPPDLLGEATDHPPEVHMAPHKFNLIKKLTQLHHDNNNDNPAKIPELQVGCADGFIKENKLERPSTLNEKIKKPARLMRKREITASKKKRSYFQYSQGSVIDIQPTFQSISVWKPPVYQLSRPYYIPIFGAPGRIPIYYPPQPFITKPIVPPDQVNSEPPYQGPAYLPPVTTQPPPDSNTTMPLDDRFNNGDDDDRPIWGPVSGENGGASTTRRPQTGIVPTRRPARPGGPPRTQPPLVHDTSNDSGGGFGGGQSNQNAAGGGARPPQPSFDRPPQTPQQIPPPTGPSSCVWAIISCCSISGEIPYNCFDQRGCPGAFWDNNPCDSDFANAAIASALNYYDRNGQ